MLSGEREHFLCPQRRRNLTHSGHKDTQVEVLAARLAACPWEKNHENEVVTCFLGTWVTLRTRRHHFRLRIANSIITNAQVAGDSVGKLETTVPWVA